MSIYCAVPDVGRSRDPVCVIKVGARSLMPVGRWGDQFHPRFRKMHAMSNPSDPFPSSVIPFEVPEQVRAFAEKGVSQARDNYAKFKDAAETHNSTIEAVFSAYSSGAKEYSAKVMDMLKASATANLDFAQELVSVKSPSAAMELWT